MCVSNREAHSLFILVSDFDNYLPGMNSLGESNNPSAPQLWDFSPRSTKGGLTSMNLHDFIILMILPIGTSRYNEIQYKIYK